MGTLENDDTGRKEAILSLSENAYKIWEAEVIDSMEYDIEHFEGYCELLRRGQAPGSARRIDDGQDCDCIVKKKNSIQCRHEYKLDGCQFVESRFTARYIKLISHASVEAPVNDGDHQLEDVVDSSAVLDQYDLDLVDDRMSQCSQVVGDKVGGDDTEQRWLDDDEEEEDSDDDDTVTPLSQPLSQLDPKKQTKEKPTSYSELLTLSTNLSNAVGGKKGVSNLVAAALLALTRIVQGSDTSDLAENSMKDYLLQFGNAFVGGNKRMRGIEFANTGNALLPLPARLPDPKPVHRQRFRSRGSPKKGGRGRIKPGEAPKNGSGSGKHCRFCGSGDHTMPGCEQHKGMGDVISHLGKFRDELFGGRMVSQPLPSEAKRPFLQSVPSDTKWLVFHRHFHIISGAAPNISENRLAEVSCYGITGQELCDYKGRHCVFVGGFCQWIGNQMPKHAGSRPKKNVFSTYEKETFQVERVEGEVVCE
jgi:hypothetical protein